MVGATTTGPPSGTASTPTAAADLGLKTPGELSVASDIPYAPFEFTDPGSSEVKGFDVDLVNAIAPGLGITKVTFVKTRFATHHPADPSAAASTCRRPRVSITPERAKVVDFSDPYFTADQSVMVQADSTITNLDGLQGKTIGAQRGTTGADLAATVPGATVKRYEIIDDAFNALAQGRVDGVVNDFSISAYAAAQKPQLKVVQRVPTHEGYGLVFPKDNPALRDAFNAGLAKIKADGTYDAIYMKWFGQAPPKG